ncbi:MAG: hypothetical protein WD038_03940 [Balneolales bacterium]
MKKNEDYPLTEIKARFITKQIKRTRLRYITYIQLLSRAANLPNRWAAKMKSTLCDNARCSMY